MEQYKHIRQIFSRYMDGSITEAERTELSEAAETYSTKEWEEILEPLLSSFSADAGFNIADWEKEIQYILAQPKEEKKVVRMSNWRKIAVAASIIAIIGLGVFVISKRSGKSPATAETRTKDIPAPSNTRAVITLADGRKVYLDSVNNGTIAQENNVNIVKNENGTIVYSHEDTKTQSQLVYNTLSNPRGSKVIDMTLSDGSHVWLNSGSSIKYPVAFIDNERKVEITGEAYFEVAHNAANPFKVSKGETEVTVLGTHFNVNAYDNEESLKVTLLEGSVKVAGSKSQVTIKPGEQAVVANSIEVKKGVDVDEVMAWKNGTFLLDNTGLPAIMRQISRWYDVDVVYESKIPDTKFVGGVSKNLPLSKVLELLRSNGIETKLEGKKIIVTQ